MNSKSLLLGFFIGGIAASVSVLLTAPSSGKDSRSNIKENTDGWLKQFSAVKDNLSEVKTAVATVASEGTEAIKDFAFDLKTAVSDWKNDIQPHQYELQKELKEIELSIHALESELNEKREKHYRSDIS